MNTFIFKRLTAIWIATMLAATPAWSRSKKGEKLVKEGRVAEARREFDKALELYEQAVQDDPQDPSYQLAARRVRFQAGQQHVERGQKIREEGKLEEAAAEFQRGFAVDPSSSIAAAELKRALVMIEAAKRKAAGAKTDEKPSAPDPRKELEDRISALQPLPELRPITRQITTLKMNNQPVKVLFETLGKIAGINMIWDPEYQSSGKQYSVDVSNTTFELALEHMSILTKTFWKPLSANTIFLTNDNVTKRRDHEEMLVKTFYLRNLTTPQELQEVATILRTLADIRRVFTYNSQNIIMVRGEADKVLLAEKLISDLDKPKGEVVIDVYVMEANRARTRDLAATFLGQGGFRSPLSFLGGTTTGGSTTSGTGTTGTTSTTGASSTTSTPTGVVRLTRLGDIGLNDFAIQVPSALLQSLMSDRGTRVMQSPQLRATHGVKSSLKIGDRYPYAVGSFQPGVGAIGVSPLVSTQFQFADVGVNVDITPTIHGAEEATLQVEVDISNIRDRVDIGGLSQPVIGQRKFTHNIRLRAGEISLLGGLMQNQDTKSVSGTAGLAHIPVIGRLFSNESVEKSQGELLIALVPHIVRAPDISDMNLRGIAAGSESVVKVNYASRGEAAAEASKPAPAPMAPPVTPLPLPGLAPSAPPAAPAAPKLSFQPGAAQAKLSEAVTVTLQLDNVQDLTGAPLRVRWDPKILRLNDATRGELFGSDGTQPIFTRNIRNDEGEVSVIQNRVPGAPGVSGSGSLLKLVFQAVGKGSSSVNLIEFNVRDSQGRPLVTEAPALTVTVE